MVFLLGSVSSARSKGKASISFREPSFMECLCRISSLISFLVCGRWVNLQVKLVTWEHLNFSLLLRTSTRLYAIVDKVRERHGGSINDIILYRHQVCASIRHARVSFLSLP